MTNKTYTTFFIIIVAILLIVGFFVVKNKKISQVVPTELNSAAELGSVNTANTTQSSVMSAPVQMQKRVTVDPIENALSRITKKPFGIFITPKTSPVQPERFQGYHTGTDLETTPAEQNVDVPVVALCDGKLLAGRSASGYGGVAVQSCTLDGSAVTVVYGHIRLASVKPKVGGQIKAGEFLANLGTGFSSQTDGERKHLHLAVHLGTVINILGYVQNKTELSGWLDAAKFLN